MSGTPRLSVLTPSCRPEGLVMVADCLGRQTIRDFEWIICVPAGTAAPEDLVAYLRARVPALRFLADPPRRPGDFYRLNGAFNKLVRAARADLIVWACDWIWFGEDVLERFLATYAETPDAVVSAFGHHYRKVVDGRPEVLWNYDIRPSLTDETGRMIPEHMELSLCAMSRDKVLEVGGFDEVYDEVAGNSEKELALRMAKAGCQFFLALGCEHRIFTHPKTDPAVVWDEKYRAACDLYLKHAAEIEAGMRFKIDSPQANNLGSV